MVSQRILVAVLVASLQSCLVWGFATTGSVRKQHVSTVPPRPFPTQQWTASKAGSTYSNPTALRMSSDNNNLPFWLDPNTKGGAVFLSIVLFIVPVLFYNFVINVFGFDSIEAGKWIGVGFTVISIFVWVGTYIFRVATKDMTYVRMDIA